MLRAPGEAALTQDQLIRRPAMPPGAWSGQQHIVPEHLAGSAMNRLPIFGGSEVHDSDYHLNGL